MKNTGQPHLKIDRQLQMNITGQPDARNLLADPAANLKSSSEERGRRVAVSSGALFLGKQVFYLDQTLLPQDY